MDANTANSDDYIRNILPEIQKRIAEHKSSKSIETIFYETMEDVVKAIFRDEKYDFITYINIWNQAKKDNLGKIEFYSNHFFQSPDITNDRKKIIGIKQDYFNKKQSIPISYVFQKNRIFGASFCIVLKDKYVVPDSIDFSCYPYQPVFPDDLQKLVDKLSNSEQNKFQSWVDSVDHCYGDNDNTTHFFFYNGSIYYGKEEKKQYEVGKDNNKQQEENLENNLALYVLYANIGIHIDDESTEEKKRFIYSFLRRIRKLIEQISFNLIVDIKDYQMRQEAVRAAIAQVMARNMSHNFGSHVLSNLVGDGVYEKLEDEAVKKLKSFNPKETDEVYKDLYKALEEPEKSTENNKSKNHQLQYFFQYLKSRMDYLSEVTFGVPNLLTTKMMYGEVMKELDQVRILLNYISGVSNFKYKFKLMVVDEKGEKEMTADNDIGVAFPSDVLGCHAFYNIIENIIRNTAKHAKNDGQTVTFTITFKDVNEGIEEAAELYCMEIDNGVYEEGIDELVKKQNDRLNQSVLENNNLRSNSLGLLEMEASAAFLRQIDLPEIESEDYTIDYGTPEELSRYYHERNGKKRLNILKAFAIDKQQDNTGRLGYRFFVQKPKEFLFVGNWDDVGKAKKKEMLNIGIQFISANQFMTDLEKEKAFAHQFMVYDSSLCEAVAEKLKKARIISNKYNNDNNDKLKEIKEQLHSYSTLLPLRKLKISEDEKKTISSYWSSNKQVNSSKGKTNKVGNAHDKAILQKLKERAWERYYKNELLKEEMEPLPNIFIRSSFDSSCSNQVVFLDHANEEGHLKECKHISKGKEVYIENLTSQTRVKLPVFTELSKGRKEKLINNYVNNIRALNNDDSDLSGKKRMIREEIFEAYHNKVIILDERVQQFAEKNSEGEEPKIPCWKLFSSTNVHIPRRPKYDNNGNPIPLKDLYGNELDVDDFRVFSLDPNDFGEIKEKVKAFVDYYSKEYNSKSKPFILVHYGILERMCGGDVKEINELLKQWVKMAKRVVVTSGRGAHSLDLPKSVCFVNLSSVLYVCNENRNKYLINYLLNQSRRKRNE